MVRKSYGKMRGTRQKLRVKEKLGMTTYTKSFEIGDKVHINLKTGKIPHPKFHGSTGEIIGKMGRGYIVAVRDKKAVKKIMLRPEHLRALE